VHDKGDGNPHAHIMLTMRPIEPSGKWGQKSNSINGKKVPTVDWNDRANSNEWRELWADEVNAFLERENRTERIDHRSNAERGIEEIPTVHLGVSAHQMEQKGTPTKRGNLNRAINNMNTEMRQLKARLAKLDSFFKEEIQTTQNVKPPTLHDVIQNILNRQAQAGKVWLNSFTVEHNPYALISFLSAYSLHRSGDDYDNSFVASDNHIRQAIERFINTMYTVTHSTFNDERYEWIYNENTGEWSEKKYFVRVLSITVTKRTPEQTVWTIFNSGNPYNVAMYEYYLAFMETNGFRPELFPAWAVDY
jgi:hypothetical protein